MPKTHPSPGIDLSQIRTRNTHARHIVAGCTSALPALAGTWRELDDALTDTATLATHIARLSADLQRTRLDAANLRAAIRAALAAHAEGEPDPLWYLHDELNASHGPADTSRRPA
jgi:outer membrane murein-binding lipoprotein Lpp